MQKLRYYSPRIARPLITRLYHEARTRGLPMTVLVNQLVADGLTRPVRPAIRDHWVPSETQK